MPPTTSLKLQHARLKHLLSAEGQQLPGQGSGAFSRLLNFHDAFLQRVSFLHL